MAKVAVVTGSVKSPPKKIQFRIKYKINLFHLLIFVGWFSKDFLYSVYMIKFS
jgi:hypothetical protein